MFVCYLPHGNQAVSSSGAALSDLVRGGSKRLGAVVVGHGLDTSANADLDDTGLDGSGDLDNSLETRRALTVDGVDRGALGEASVEGGHTGVGGSTASGQNIANSNVVDKSRVDLGLLKDTLEDTRQDLCT